MLNRLCYDIQRDGLRSPMKVPKLTASCLSVIALLVSPAISAVPQLQPSKQPKFCIDYNSSDQYQELLTSSMAVSDRYIVFGNYKTNQVTIYQRDDQDRWLKFRTITPPTDSPFAKIGSGFGGAVAFDRDTLIISAYAGSNSPTERELFQQVTDGGQYFASAIYKTSISTVDKLLRIDHPAPREITGGNLAIHNGRIAFGIYRSYLPERIPDTSIGILSSRGLQIIKNPVLSDISFGGGIALRDNILITLSKKTDMNGSMWIYDLDKPTARPKKVSLEFWPDQVRISDKFIIVGASRNIPNSSTFLLNRSNLSKVIIKGDSNVDVNDRIMVRSHPGANYGEVFIPAQLEIFDLRKNTHRLIERREGSYRLALLSQNYLFSIERKNDIDNICIERTSI
jgi:hypothetical protein